MNENDKRTELPDINKRIELPEIEKRTELPEIEKRTELPISKQPTTAINTEGGDINTGGGDINIDVTININKSEGEGHALQEIPAPVKKPTPALNENPRKPAISRLGSWIWSWIKRFLRIF